MEYIISFFETIADFLGTIAEMFIEFVTNVIGFFTSVPEHVETIEGFAELFPEPVQWILLMAVAAQLIFLIIGRRGL